ncbi:cysteine proteinase [Choiromyces venosus 120613-1]|uniref:ubiquitinyl hydrolase 1 n=1 Tax=Choiromyces venosus 120613-1 TaxID=1336337 RepID=A0A3N4J9X5_9PEZI|nr:cysteine proteinase [Choiromyces venosus 120613-1]
MGEMLRDLPSPTPLPGKCAPRFWADLTVYNPLRKERNFLPDTPPHFDSQLPASYEPKHKHVLDVITEKSFYVKNEAISIDQTYNIAAICQSCRMHFNIEIEFTKPVEFGADVIPCPNKDSRNQYRHSPLHHFRYEAKVSSPLDTSRYDKKSRERWMDKRVFSCSSTNCPIVVTVTTQPAMIRPGLLDLLISEKSREIRVKEAARINPNDVPADVAPQTPYQVLETLCTYIKNHKSGDQRSIFAENKRYLCNLGEDCGEVMNLAHFTKSTDPNTNAWIPASPVELNDPHSEAQQDLCGLLEEVTILMDDEKRRGVAPAKSGRVRQKTERAELGAKWLLAFHKYDNTNGWQFDLTVPEHPHYAGIGAVGDMSDALINWAYERQRACDPFNAPYYFGCFEDIARGRESENLQFEVARLRSEGQFSTSDLENSYKSLDIDPVTSDDDLIVGVFKSRLADAPRQEGPMREDMRIIGTARRSEKILSFAKLAVGDVADAYKWLRVLESSEDQYILSAYKVRVEDNPNDEIAARNALKLIAENRQSNVLYGFLEGNLFETPLEIDAAYSRLGIDDRTLSEDLIIHVFELRKQDAPSQTQDLRAALRSIGLNRNSIKIQSYLETGNSDGITKGSTEWPVGLENIGNTCYLNSLLQFYFTVKPLREMILNIDQFQEGEINDEVIERKRVGEPHNLTGIFLLKMKRRRSDEYQCLTIQTRPMTKKIFPRSKISPRAPIGVASKAGQTYGPLTPPPDMPDRPPPIPPRPTKQDSKPDTNLMFGRQQDVTECIGNVMFQVEAAIKPEYFDENEEQMDLVKKLFYGRTKQTLSFPNSAETRTKEELFSHLLVDVAEGDRDIYSALDSSFDIEQVDLEGREAKRFLSISHLPPILQIQVQRVQYDRAKASAYKSNSHLKFPDTIYLDRYMETDEPDLKAKREESWVWKEELKALEQRLAELTKTPAGIRVPKALEYTHQWLSELKSDDEIEVQPALLKELEQRAVSMRQESETIEARIQELQSRIEQQFTDSCKQGYRIHSVFIHRGSANFGHYWIYIYDFQRKLFRKYNDGYVTEVTDPQEVFIHGDINPPTPYFLVFVKEDQSLDIMEAVQRQMAIVT